MKQLIGYLKTYYREEFKWGYAIFILLFTGVLLYINYFTPFLKDIRREYRWTDYAILYYIGLYGSCFTIAVLAQRLFYPKAELAFLKDYRFWLILLFALVMWSNRNSLIYYYSVYMTSGLPQRDAQAQAKFRDLFMLLKSLYGFVPLFIYWWLVDRKNQPFYGMRRKDLDLRPYLVLLALMIPVIVIAAQNPGFLKKYPRAQVMPAIELFNPDHAGYIAGYETLYVLDFYIIELFFRGFMILAFLKIAGPKIVLPTAVFYCALHFGKPFGEAMSSLFGGTVLGVITYYSRSIWGGIIIHMGIALTMEVSAYLVLLFKN